MAAAFQDLGALTLGDHALPLEPQIVLRGLAEPPVEEDRLDVGPLHFVNEQPLKGVAPDRPNLVLARYRRLE
ncbi:hypothetical protein [Azospirillum endophyticum]